MYPDYRQKYLFTPFLPEETTGTASGEAKIKSSGDCSTTDTDHTIYVTPDDLYTPEHGYGFITEKNMEQVPLLKFPEFNGGFMPLAWYRHTELTQVRQNDCGCTLSCENLPASDQGRQIPLRFKCNVPASGSYLLKVCIRAGEDISDLRIFTGRRVLAAYRETLLAKEALTLQLSVEVCGIIPRGEEKSFENNCIELSITADRPYISELEITNQRMTRTADHSDAPITAGQYPVLYIAGDSTVTDQFADYPYAPETSYAGWGQMLPCFLENGITVSNHSHSGLTTESFRTEGHADIPMNRFKEGDYMLFQFAHNDQKLMHLKAREGYLTNLENYVRECREKKGYPLIVTPVARNSWRGDDGNYNDLLEEYAQACLSLGEKLSVPVLDLHRLSVEFVTGLRKEKAKKYFYPSDYTHFNDFGAWQIAAMVCREMIRVCSHLDAGYRRLAAMVKKEVSLWPEPKFVALPKCPDGFLMEETAPEFEEPDRPSDVLLRAEALDMVIRRAGFFTTNVYNDLFTDVIGHEWYAGTIECGLQNGILDGKLCENRKFYPTEPITLLDFILFLMMAYKSRRTLPETKPTPYDAAVSKEIQPLISAACELGILSTDEPLFLEQTLSRSEGAAICRKLKIM